MTSFPSDHAARPSTGPCPRLPTTTDGPLTLPPSPSDSLLAEPTTNERRAQQVVSLDPSAADELVSFAKRKAALDARILSLEALPYPDPFLSDPPCTPAELESWCRTTDAAQHHAAQFQEHDLDHLRSLAKASVAKPMTPADTDLVELALNTLYALDKLLLLLARRTTQWSLLRARLAWDRAVSHAWTTHAELLRAMSQAARPRALQLLPDPPWPDSPAPAPSHPASSSSSSCGNAAAPSHLLAPRTTDPVPASSAPSSSLTVPQRGMDVSFFTRPPPPSPSPPTRTTASTPSRNAMTRSAARELLLLDVAQLRAKVGMWSSRDVGSAATSMDTMIECAQVPNRMLDGQDALENAVDDLHLRLGFLAALAAQSSQAEETVVAIRALSKKADRIRAKVERWMRPAAAAAWEEGGGDGLLGESLVVEKNRSEGSLAGSTSSCKSKVTAWPDPSQRASIARKVVSLRSKAAVLAASGRGTTSSSSSSPLPSSPDSTVSRILDPTITPTFPRTLRGVIVLSTQATPTLPTHPAYPAQASANATLVTGLTEVLHAALAKVRKAITRADELERAATALDAVRRAVLWAVEMGVHAQQTAETSVQRAQDQALCTVRAAPDQWDVELVGTAVDHAEHTWDEALRARTEYDATLTRHLNVCRSAKVPSTVLQGVLDDVPPYPAWPPTLVNREALRDAFTWIQHVAERIQVHGTIEDQLRAYADSLRSWAGRTLPPAHEVHAVLAPLVLGQDSPSSNHLDVLWSHPRPLGITIPPTLPAPPTMEGSWGGQWNSAAQVLARELEHRQSKLSGSLDELSRKGKWERDRTEQAHALMGVVQRTIHMLVNQKEVLAFVHTPPPSPADSTLPSHPIDPRNATTTLFIPTRSQQLDWAQTILRLGPHALDTLQLGDEIVHQVPLLETPPWEYDRGIDPNVAARSVAHTCVDLVGSAREAVERALDQAQTWLDVSIRAEAEAVEQANAEADALTARAEQDEVARKRTEQDRLDKERVEQERLEQERLEQEKEHRSRLEDKEKQRTNATRAAMQDALDSFQRDAHTLLNQARAALSVPTQPHDTSRSPTFSDSTPSASNPYRLGPDEMRSLASELATLIASAPSRVGVPPMPLQSAKALPPEPAALTVEDAHTDEGRIGRELGMCCDQLDQERDHLVRKLSVADRASAAARDVRQRFEMALAAAQAAEAAVQGIPSHAPTATDRTARAPGVTSSEQVAASQAQSELEARLAAFVAEAEALEARARTLVGAAVPDQDALNQIAQVLHDLTTSASKRVGIDPSPLGTIPVEDELVDTDDDGDMTMVQFPSSDDAPNAAMGDKSIVSLDAQSRSEEAKGAQARLRSTCEGLHPCRANVLRRLEDVQAANEAHETAVALQLPTPLSESKQGAIESVDMGKELDVVPDDLIDQLKSVIDKLQRGPHCLDDVDDIMSPSVHLPGTQEVMWLLRQDLDTVREAQDVLLHSSSNQSTPVDEPSDSVTAQLTALRTQLGEAMSSHSARIAFAMAIASFADAAALCDDSVAEAHELVAPHAVVSPSDRLVDHCDGGVEPGQGLTACRSNGKQVQSSSTLAPTLRTSVPWTPEEIAHLTEMDVLFEAAVQAYEQLPEVQSSSPSVSITVSTNSRSLSPTLKPVILPDSQPTDPPPPTAVYPTTPATAELSTSPMPQHPSQTQVATSEPTKTPLTSAVQAHLKGTAWWTLKHLGEEMDDVWQAATTGTGDATHTSIEPLLLPTMAFPSSRDRFTRRVSAGGQGMLSIGEEDEQEETGSTEVDGDAVPATEAPATSPPKRRSLLGQSAAMPRVPARHKIPQQADHQPVQRRSQFQRTLRTVLRSRPTTSPSMLARTPQRTPWRNVGRATLNISTPPTLDVGPLRTSPSVSPRSKLGDSPRVSLAPRMPTLPQRTPPGDELRINEGPRRPSVSKIQRPHSAAAVNKSSHAQLRSPSGGMSPSMGRTLAPSPSKASPSHTSPRRAPHGSYPRSPVPEAVSHYSHHASPAVTKPKHTFPANSYHANPNNLLDVTVGNVVRQLPVAVAVRKAPDQPETPAAPEWKDKVGYYMLEDPENPLSEPRVVYCRILRSKTVMVRIGGGWQELASFITQHFTGQVDISVTANPRSASRSQKLSTTKVDHEILEANSLMLTPNDSPTPVQRVRSRLTSTASTGCDSVTSPTGRRTTRSPTSRLPHTMSVGTSTVAISPITPAGAIRRPQSVATTGQRSPSSPTTSTNLGTRIPSSASLGRNAGKESALRAAGAAVTGGESVDPSARNPRAGTRIVTDPLSPDNHRSVGLQSLFGQEDADNSNSTSTPLRAKTPSGIHTPLQSRTPSRIPTPLRSRTPLNSTRKSSITPSHLGSASRAAPRSASRASRTPGTPSAEHSTSPTASRIPRLNHQDRVTT